MPELTMQYYVGKLYVWKRVFVLSFFQALICSFVILGTYFAGQHGLRLTQGHLVTNAQRANFLIIVTTYLLTINIPKTSTGMRKRGKNVMFKTSFIANMIACLLVSCFMKVFYYFNWHFGKWWYEIAGIFSLVYFIVLPGTIITLYIWKKHHKKKYLQKIPKQI